MDSTMPPYNAPRPPTAARYTAPRASWRARASADLGPLPSVALTPRSKSISRNRSIRAEVVGPIEPVGLPAAGGVGPAWKTSWPETSKGGSSPEARTASRRFSAASRMVRASPQSSTSSPARSDRRSSSSGGSSSLLNRTASSVLSEVLVERFHEDGAADDHDDRAYHQCERRCVEALVEDPEVKSPAHGFRLRPGYPVVEKHLQAGEDAHRQEKACPHDGLHRGKDPSPDVLREVLVQECVRGDEQITQQAAAHEYHDQGQGVEVDECEHKHGHAEPDDRTCEPLPGGKVLADPGGGGCSDHYPDHQPREDKGELGICGFQHLL